MDWLREEGGRLATLDAPVLSLKGVVTEGCGPGGGGTTLSEMERDPEELDSVGNLAFRRSSGCMMARRALFLSYTSVSVVNKPSEL